MVGSQLDGASGHAQAQAISVSRRALRLLQSDTEADEAPSAARVPGKARKLVPKKSTLCQERNIGASVRLSIWRADLKGLPFVPILLSDGN